MDACAPLPPPAGRGEGVRRALSIFHEARLAARRLLRDPFLSLLAVVALTLGIGLTASMISITYSVLARGMPFEDPEELVAISRTSVENGLTTQMVGFLNFLDCGFG